MKKIMVSLIGWLGLAVGLAIILPALAKHRQIEVWNSEVVVPMVVGIIITLIGVSMAIYAFKKRKA
jgi:uncharacterized membrane protein HdeD (DUF308 family)